MAASVPSELFVFFPLSKCLEDRPLSCVSHRQLGLMAQHVFMWGVCEGYCSLGLGSSCFQAVGKLQTLKTLFIQQSREACPLLPPLGQRLKHFSEVEFRQCLFLRGFRM